MNSFFFFFLGGGRMSKSEVGTFQLYLTNVVRFVSGIRCLQATALMEGNEGFV